MRLRSFLAFAFVAACGKAPVPPPPDASTIAVASVSPVADAAPTVEETADAAPEPWDAATCSVVLGGLLDGHVARGVRNTPSRQATLDRLDPKTRQQWYGRDHGVSYLLCRYAVRVNGHAFTYDHQAGQAIGDPSSLDEKKCATEEERAKVVADIKKHTNQCADPHAGAYWGYDLVPAKK